MIDKDTLLRPTKPDGEKQVDVPFMAKSRTILDMGEASREEGFRLNGCR